MIKDYEITHGMVAGKDYRIAAVVHSGGGWQMLKDSGFNGKGDSVTGRNKFQGLVEGLGATEELIDGVKFVTAGVTSIAEFQSRGYRYVQP
jgi:intracellular sulfur oxidation DsrE/DsrF family protein